MSSARITNTCREKIAALHRFGWPDVPSYRQNSRTLLQIGEEVMDHEMRREFSKLHDALIHVGAKNDFGWISFAFTVNYVLLGIILWRLFG